ncbi:mitochondrial folate transporter/carrier [Camelus ferus]|nr:mitochondrial folate transporter/carrier [Camelus ferus]
MYHQQREWQHQLLSWELHSASQHQAAIALNCVCEHLCFIWIYFVHPLARCVLSYNAIKSYKTEGRAERLEATEYLISAAEAGAMTLCITNPLWVTKTRLMLQYDGVVNASQRQYKGMFDTLVKIYKYEGVRGLYKGFVPGLFGTSHGALQFMAYELLKLKYNQHINRLPEAQLSTVEYISVAALSKIFAVAATYPYQVVRARLQDQHMSYSGVLDVITKTWRRLKDGYD